MNKTGFGFLRIPQNEDKTIDYAALNPLVDHFLEQGGTYFDTAYTYLNGLSEEALRLSLVERYPRERFQIADKLPGYKAKTYEQCWDFFNEQLQRCGVSFFDVYLLHFLNEKNYATAQRLEQFRFLQELKEKGLAKRVGFSYHDSPELLDKILTDHPEVEIVQLQINYLDWDSVSLRARELYEVAVAHDKDVVIMEPVKGGSLANLPEEAAAVLRAAAPEESCASWAIRFATDLSQVSVVLSGMNTMEQLRDNMRDFRPLCEQERQLLDRCAEIIRSNTAVACTSCGYCEPNCPVGMPIPKLYALYNDYSRTPGEDWKMQPTYNQLSTKASACIGCGTCEKNCPQKLKITEHLAEVAKVFEKTK